jgi:hypothetical protein
MSSMTIEVQDVSGQKKAQVSGISAETTVRELINSVALELELPEESNGRPLVYHARLDREGRHLHASEIVTDALQENDVIVLHPNIDAGFGGARRP